VIRSRRAARPWGGLTRLWWRKWSRLRLRSQNSPRCSLEEPISKSEKGRGSGVDRKVQTTYITEPLTFTNTASTSSSSSSYGWWPSSTSLLFHLVATGSSWRTIHAPALGCTSCNQGQSWRALYAISSGRIRPEDRCARPLGLPTRPGFAPTTSNRWRARPRNYTTTP
jgi:hypothetical protein